MAKRLGNLTVGAMALATALVSGCTTDEVGAAIGGLAGGVLGSQFGSGSGQIFATAIGAAVGAYFGAEIARALTEEDKKQMSTAAGDVLSDPSEGATREWSNPESGNSGVITADLVYADDRTGEACRTFSQTVTLADGTTETANGRACQKDDGSWVLEA
ncbi:MAG: RT0821/Lpp0805 family surface protein [Pseudomonadota bacterium]